MKVTLNQSQNLAELWVPNGTPEEQVVAGIKEYAGKHRVVVYRSGTRDLTAVTQSLLSANL
ncbi:MAG: hypothetical protein H6Q61_1012 [Firmicutes bacterium]|nr:hypothetical protein [Bacillota bacterium]